MITQEGKKAALKIFGPQVGQKIINLANAPRSAARTKATPGLSFMDQFSRSKTPTGATGAKTGLERFFGKPKQAPGANALLTAEYLKGKFHR